MCETELLQKLFNKINKRYFCCDRRMPNVEM